MLPVLPFCPQRLCAVWIQTIVEVTANLFLLALKWKILMWSRNGPFFCLLFFSSILVPKQITFFFNIYLMTDLDMSFSLRWQIPMVWIYFHHPFLTFSLFWKMEMRIRQNPSRNKSNLYRCIVEQYGRWSFTYIFHVVNLYFSMILAVPVPTISFHLSLYLVTLEVH